MPQDNKTKLQEFEQDKLRQLLVQNWDLNGRRLINAGNAINPQDYVTKDQLDLVASTHSDHGIIYADDPQYAGANFGIKINNALNALSGYGGIVDARGLTGEQFVTTNIFNGITKTFVLLLGNVQIRFSVPQTLKRLANCIILGSSSASEIVTFFPYYQTLFIWDGPAGGTFLTYDSCRSVDTLGIGILKGVNTIGTAIQIDSIDPSGVNFSTANYFERITIDVCNLGILIGNTSTANNDLHHFNRVFITGAGIYGYYIHNGQSKGIKIDRGSIGFRSYGIWTDAGSFSVDKMNFSHNTVDISLGGPTDTIGVTNCQSEGATRFLEMNQPQTGAPFPVTIQNCRLDTGSAIGVTDYIKFNSPGPLQLLDNLIGGGFYDAAFSFNIGAPTITEICSEGNVFPNINVFNSSLTFSNLTSLNDRGWKSDNSQTIPVIPYASGSKFQGSVYAIAEKSKSNISSITYHNNAEFLRLGTTCTVSFWFTITPTGVGNTQVSFTLPIASTLLNYNYLAGTAAGVISGGGAPNIIGAVYPDLDPNNGAILFFYSPDGTARDWWGTFQYFIG